MELASKSKHFGFKSKKRSEKKLSDWFSSNIGDDVEIEETNKTTPHHKKDVIKTPVRPSDTTLSPLSQNSSPQFRVGWNDGFQKSSCVMNSPVSIVPTRRKIRRCPENLLSKMTTPNPKERSIDEENGCDILQCISFAKSVIESPSFQTRNDEDDYKSYDENVNKITESIKDTSLDILDDSSNELMILCSQAVEESVSAVKPIEILKPAEKHSITPDRGRNASKRFKSQMTPKDLLKKNGFCINDRLNNLNQNTSFSCPGDSSLKKNENCFKPPQTFINNNNSFKNFNKSIPSCSKSADASQRKKTNLFNSSIKTAIAPLPSQPVSASSNDDIKSHLNDEDDIFCSLDFNFLDSLQTQATQSFKTVPKPTINAPVKNSVPLTLNTKSLVTKYTKEEIEKRRLEAKKRLLFNKKHRSM